MTALALGLVALTGARSFGQTAQFMLLNSFGSSGDGSLHPGERSYLTDANNLQRGMAYNPVTGHLLIASRAPTTAPTINIVDSITGEDLGSLPFVEQVIAGNAGFLLNKIAVADDGAIYVCNVTTASTPQIGLVVYRYASETSEQTGVYGNLAFGDPSNGAATSSQSNGRWGDTMIVRGAGINTQILLASQGTLAAILRPTDETLTAFTATTLATDASSGSMADSLSFGAGDTFWAKATGFALRRLSFDLNAGTATTTQSFGSSVFPTQIGPIFALNASNLLVGVEIAPGADFVKLYDISTANPPVFLDRQDYYTNLNNGLGAGEICYGNGTFYALNSDNGILALMLVSSNHSVAPSFFVQPVNGGTRLIGSNVTFTAAADGIPAEITYEWYFNETELIADATNASLALANLQTTNSGSYRVVAMNSAGSATSSVVTLAVVPESVLFVYEPFDYPAGDALTNFSPGLGLFWTNNGTPADTLVAPTNLTIPGLVASLGNSITNGGSGGAARLPISATVSSGSLYASFAMNVIELGASFSANAPGLLASFFNSGGPTTDQQPRLYLQRTNSNDYLLGIAKVTANGANYDPTVYTEGEQHFIVMRYTFVTGSTANDTVDLWINPDPSTFGLADPPPPTVSAVVTNNDVSGLNMMAFRQNTTGNTPININYDELRIGNKWALVTPAFGSNLRLTIERNGQNIVLSWPVNGTDGFVLESAAGLESPIDWTPVSEAVVIQGANNTVTVAISGTETFFRLRN